MKVCIALGSNLGDRVSLIQQARDRILALPACSGLSAQAPLYESAPVDCPDGSGAFINTVIEIEWSATLTELLESALQIEADLGRIRTMQNAPRPVDIDLICAGQSIVKLPKLELPHPRLHQRRFVLEPLSSIAPELTLPGLAKPIIELLSAVKDQDLKLSQTEW